jgi:hypothetical protein
VQATGSPTSPPTATPPAATRNPNLPIIDLTAINATATALASGLPTAAPTVGAQATTPGTSGPPTITPAPGTATVQRGVDVLAYCDNPIYGVRPPTTLAAGSSIDVWWGWFARTRDQIQSHLDAVVYEVRLNGELIQNWRLYSRPVALENDGNYHIYWYVPSEALPSGENRITYRVTWTESITDGYESFGPGTSTLSQEGSCTFTVR